MSAISVLDQENETSRANSTKNLGKEGGSRQTGRTPLGLRARDKNLDNAPLQTPRRKALGDLKNVVQHQQDSLAKFGAKSFSQNATENVLKPAAKPKSRTESLAQSSSSSLAALEKVTTSLPSSSTFLSSIPENRILINDNDEDEIEYMPKIVEPPDNFDDILGPVKDRISSIPVSQWNNLIPNPASVLDEVFPGKTFEEQMKELGELIEDIELSIPDEAE